jgi:hypothetical protein
MKLTYHLKLVGQLTYFAPVRLMRLLLSIQGAGYIYVNNEQVQSNAGLYAELRTTLTSFLSDYESSGTVEFWYWAGLGTTQFELRYQETDLNLPSTIWQITHDVQDITSERWRKGEATFCNPKKQFTPLAFRVTPGPGFRLAGLDELVSYFHTGKTRLDFPYKESLLACCSSHTV